MRRSYAPIHIHGPNGLNISPKPDFPPPPPPSDPTTPFRPNQVYMQTNLLAPPFSHFPYPDHGQQTTAYFALASPDGQSVRYLAAPLIDPPADEPEERKDLGFWHEGGFRREEMRFTTALLPIDGVEVSGEDLIDAVIAAAGEAEEGRGGGLVDFAPGAAVGFTCDQARAVLGEIYGRYPRLQALMSISLKDGRFEATGPSRAGYYAQVRSGLVSMWHGGEFKFLGVTEWQGVEWSEYKRAFDAVVAREQEDRKGWGLEEWGREVEERRREVEERRRREGERDRRWEEFVRGFTRAEVPRESRVVIEEDSGSA